MVGKIVRVEVILSLLRHLGTVAVNILQAAGKALSPALPDIGHSGIDGLIGGIGFGGGGQQHRRFRQRDAGFRQAQLHGGIHAGFYRYDSLRIGQPNILGRNDQQPPAGGKQVAGFQQTAQVMHSGIGVGTANGLLQCRKEIKMLVALAVVAHGAALGGFLCIGQRDDRLPGGGQRA